MPQTSNLSPEDRNFCYYKEGKILIPARPGYYWGKLRIPAEGTHEAELWNTSVADWEIVQVNENVVDWMDNPAEDEALSVSVPGIRETQWREGFIWGPFVAPLNREVK